MSRGNKTKELDPRAKIVSIGMISILPLFSDSWECIAVSAIYLISYAALHGIRHSRLLTRTLKVSWFIGTIIILQAFSVDGAIALALGGFFATWEGLETGVILSSRLIILLWGSSNITWSTSPAEIVSAFEVWLNPLRHRFGALVMLLSIALNMAPELVLRSRQLGMSFRARGIDVDSSTGRRIRFLSTAAVPLFSASSRGATQLATAMESRGYDPRVHRTTMVHLRFDTSDWFLVGLSVAIVCASLALFA